MDARDALIAKISQQWDPNDESAPHAVVSLEDFFEGNNDEGSIGCNLNEFPDLSTFYKVLKRVSSKPVVGAVFVRINMIEDTWPFSDVVYIVTSARIDAVRQWLEPLQPSSVEEGLYLDDQLANGYAVPDGMRVTHAWWD